MAGAFAAVDNEACACLGFDGVGGCFVFLLALSCEYIDSSLGMGYGTALTPLLYRDGNVDFWRDRKARSAAVSLSLLSVIGAIAAVFFAISIPAVWLKATIAVVICFSGVAVLASRSRERLCREQSV